MLMNSSILDKYNVIIINLMDKTIQILISMQLLNSSNLEKYLTNNGLALLYQFEELKRIFPLYKSINSVFFKREFYVSKARL